jgi:predicted membrane protein
MKHHPLQKSRHTRAGAMTAGVVIIALGILFLFNNLGIMDTRQVFRLWPVLLIIAGVLKIIQSRSSASWMIGGILIFIGAAMTLHRLGIIYFNWHLWWPVVLIIVGIALLSRAWTGFHRGATLSEDGYKNDSEAVVNLLAFMGANRIKNVSQDFRGGEATAVMGGVEMDLRQASMNGEAVLNIFAFWGGIDIQVPADWTVVLNGIPLLGGFTDKTMPPADTQNKRLVIKGYAIMGGVEIKN